MGNRGWKTGSSGKKIPGNPRRKPRISNGFREIGNWQTAGAEANGLRGFRIENKKMVAPLPEVSKILRKQESRAGGAAPGADLKSARVAYTPAGERLCRPFGSGAWRAAAPADWFRRAGCGRAGNQFPFRGARLRWKFLWHRGRPFL